MERRTKLDIINLALGDASESPFLTIEAATKALVGRKILSIYDKMLHRQLTRFPWSFALKRFELNRAVEEPLTTWSYYYHFPSNYAMAWDVYSNQPNYRYPTSYDYSVYTGYFETQHEEVGAVQEGGFVASNFTSLKMYYTRDDVEPHEFTTQFIDVMERECALELAIQRNMPRDKFDKLEQRFEKHISEAKQLESMTLPKRKKIGPSTMRSRVMWG